MPLLDEEEKQCLGDLIDHIQPFTPKKPPREKREMSAELKEARSSRMKSYHQRKRQLESQNEEFMCEITRLRDEIAMLNAKNADTNTKFAQLHEMMEALDRESKIDASRIPPKRTDRGYGDCYQPLTEKDYSYFSFY